MQQSRLESITADKLAFKNLSAYVALQNPNYIFARHVVAIMQALMLVEQGKIRRLVVNLPPRHGKCPADSTPILTPVGWKKHGDLRPGDYVFGPDGKPTLVVFRSDDLDCNTEVEMTNGEIVKVSQDHLWTVYDRRSCPQTMRTIETQELAKDIWIVEKGRRGSRARWQLPDIQPIKYPTATLPVHPYVLGAWLGDGSSGQARLAHDANDDEVISGVVACGYAIRKQWIQKGTGVGYASFGSGRHGVPSQLSNSLRTIGVFNKKHIPESYLRSDIDQRLQLLAGLIDTDGNVEPKTGRVRFSTCSDALRDGVFDLTAGLGFRPYIISVSPSTSSSGIVGNKIVYQVCFQPTKSIPTKIPRKQSQCFAMRRRVAIKDIRAAKVSEVGHCIKVDREDGLYLIGKQLVVTHNTNLISEYFPAWYLGRNPSNQIIFATYSFERSGDVGRKVRNQLTDPMHSQIFPGITVSKDNAGMNRVSTTQGGNFFSVGVGGAIVGRGAHLFVIDDPIKSREEAESELQREKLIDWFRSVAYTRLMPGNAIIVVQTRWHYDDLTGFLLNDLKHENWHVLSLPAIAESDDDEMGRATGDALWPERYPVGTLDQIRETIGTREWTSQYQQSPIPSSGGMIHLDWFKRYKYSEAMLRFEQARNDRKVSMPYDIVKIVHSWDTAFKESQLNDPSACTVWGCTKNNAAFYLLETVTGRMGFPELKKKVFDVHQKWLDISGRQVPVVIEDRGSGQSLIQELRRSTGIPVIAFPPENSKQIRLDSVAPLIEGGRVFLPDRSPWLVPYETELTRFPLWKNDDMVDSTSQFLQWSSKPRFIRSKVKFWK